MLNALRNGGMFSIAKSVPSSTLGGRNSQLLFCEEKKGFDYFLESFKQGCDKHYDQIISSDFESLLKCLRDKAYNMTPQFFGNLVRSTQIINTAFSLLKDGRIDAFSPT
jgi:hypothetical protein